MTFAREFSLPDTLYFYSHSKFDHFHIYSVRVIIYFVCMYLIGMKIIQLCNLIDEV